MFGVLISQVILLPVLIFEVWFYLLVVRRWDPAGRLQALDLVVVFLAVAVCAGLLPLVLSHDSGANDKVWRPVLSVLTSFFAFPAVLGLGLLLRRRMHSGSRRDV